MAPFVPSEFPHHHPDLLQDENRCRESGTYCSAQTSDVQKECRLVIEGLELESQLAALCRRRCRTKLTRQVEKLKTLSRMRTHFPQRGGSGTVRERKEKALGSKVARKVQKEKLNHTLFQKVWLRTRKVMTVTEADSGEL